MASEPKENRPVHAHATVHVVLEIPISQGWGGDCTVDQVFKQARESAIDTLRDVFNLCDGLVKKGGCAGQVPEAHQHRVRIVGKPRVTFITAMEGKDEP